jgi:hypothetical protein
MSDRSMPFFIWVRFITAQRLNILHRRHLGAQRRDAKRDISINRSSAPEVNSGVLAAHLIGRQSTPSKAIQRAERKQRLEEALNSMESIDREILVVQVGGRGRRFTLVHLDSMQSCWLAFWSQSAFALQASPVLAPGLAGSTSEGGFSAGDLAGGEACANCAVNAAPRTAAPTSSHLRLNMVGVLRGESQLQVLAGILETSYSHFERRHCIPRPD